MTFSGISIRNRSIRARIIAIIGCLISAMVLMGLFSFVQMTAINRAAQEIQARWLPAVRLLGELRAQSARYRAILRDDLLLTDPKARANVDKLLAERIRIFDKAAAQYQAMVKSPDENALVDDVVRLWRDYCRAATEVIALSNKGDFKQAIAVNVEQATPPGRAMDAALSKLVTLNDDGAEIAGARANAVFTMATRVLLGVLLAAIALSLGAAVYLVRSIAQGINSVIRPMQSLAEGDFTVAIPHQGEPTEIGQIADKVQVFKDALIAKQASDAAAADHAAHALQRAQKLEQITASFETMIGGMVQALSSASVELEASAGTMQQTSGAAQQLSSSAASASLQVSENVQTAAGATEEISSSVREVTRRVEEASRVANDAVRQAQQTDASIGELSQAAGRIGDVVKLITAVAEQTNLLALNATIEAARAGDAGRGFAVVAAEVKNLASQTAKATEEIVSQINGIQSITQLSVGNIKEIGKTIATISEISSAVAAAVEEQGAATQEIARNVQNSARLSMQVAKDVGEVSRGTGETGAASGEVLSAAKSLAVESTRLKTEVDRFLAQVRAA
ncbi:MAG: methyl-accepting chemotaxis protein [Xanthobacteraceae bacterium]